MLIAFPILAGALLDAGGRPALGAHVFDAANGGPMLWQHLFWFFGHPEVYIIALPFFGIITEILPVFSRKPVFGYSAWSARRWRSPRCRWRCGRTTCSPPARCSLPFFSFMSFLIAVPTGVKFFNWIGTMWGGSVSFETPMLWSLGFLTTFLFGGLTGVILASPPLGLPGHRHLLRGRALPLRGVRHRGVRDVRRASTSGGRSSPAGCSTSGSASCTSGCCSSASTPRSWCSTGSASRACRGATPTTGANDGFTTLTSVHVGAFILGASTLPFLYNVCKSRRSPKVGVDDPWGWGRSLEWATSCPPPRHNFVELPRIRSESPAFDRHHPEIALAAADGASGNNLLDPDQGEADADRGPR